jgi:hypothetical protein
MPFVETLVCAIVASVSLATASVLPIHHADVLLPKNNMDAAPKPPSQMHGRIEHTKTIGNTRPGFYYPETEFIQPNQPHKTLTKDPVQIAQEFLELKTNLSLIVTDR